MFVRSSFWVRFFLSLNHIHTSLSNKQAIKTHAQNLLLLHTIISIPLLLILPTILHHLHTHIHNRPHIPPLVRIPRRRGLCPAPRCTAFPLLPSSPSLGSGGGRRRRFENGDFLAQGAGEAEAWVAIAGVVRWC